MTALALTCVSACGRERLEFAKPERVAPKMVVDGFLYVDAEDFQDYGGWRLDTQFVHLMGSPFLMAAGIGKPVADATTTCDLPRSGRYHVWVRARNWVKHHAPGRFQLVVDGVPLAKEFGAAPSDRWTWEKGGALELEKGRHRLALHDLTGFYGRCDAILLTTDESYVPPGDKEAVCKERARFLGLSLEPAFAGEYDVIVVGGGPAGVPAALAAARRGAKTALIHNRPVLGGNASAECGVGVAGAGGNHPGWRESGIIEEAGWIHRARGEINYSNAFKQMCDAEANLTVFVNQHVFEAVMDGNTRIAGVRSVSTLTGLISEYKGRVFIDCSGDGWLGYYAGADYRHGREARGEFNETRAPEAADNITMSGCLMGIGYMTSFESEKTEHPVVFERPDWVKPIESLEGHDRTLQGKVPGVGQWWMEHPGGIDDAMQAEEARDELIKVVFAFWDYVKNRSDVVEAARNYDLVTIPIVDAKRESRRLVGDYMVNQNDVESGRLFSDRVAYAGWDLDIHHPKGIYSGDEGSLDFKFNVPISSVPFRSIYSRNIENLFMAGRCISYTHVALGTVRVMSTLATVGQAAGTAAAMCIEKDLDPRALGQEYMGELQQALLRDDQTIPGIKNEDPRDLARTATVTASSFLDDQGKFAPRNVVNGWTRLAQNPASMWRSDPEQALPQWVELDFGKPTEFDTVQLTFVTDPNGYKPALPFTPSCVRDYRLSALVKGVWVALASVQGNFQRHRVHSFATQIATKLRLTVLATHGDPSASVFEIRAYNEATRGAEPRRKGDSAMDQTTTVRPTDNRKALINPRMGWTMHFYSNVPRNYGSRLQPSDTLDDFPGVSTVYLRLPWAYLEPEEGNYNWAILDTPAQRWIAKGKKIALRLTCSENWMTYATPQWVKDAGAKGTFYQYGKGRVEEGGAWDPFFDDPVFIRKLDRFLAAYAARYDGNPNVEFIDVGTYGLWGEGHTHASSLQDGIDLQKLHIDLHLKHFKKTLLCISDDFAGHDKPGARFPITDYALSKGITLRDDSILVQPPPNSWYHAEMAQAFWPELPVIIEHEHYGNSLKRNAWDVELLRKSVEEYHASFMSIHGFPDDYLADNREAVDAINLRLGYRLMPLSITWPTIVPIATQQEAYVAYGDVSPSSHVDRHFSVKWLWVNKGVAPCYPGGFPALTIKDADGGIVSVLVDETFNLRDLKVGAPNQTPVTEHQSRFILGLFAPNTRPGSYDVYISVGSRDGTPTIELPLDDGDGQRRYKIGRISLQAIE